MRNIRMPMDDSSIVRWFFNCSSAEHVCVWERETVGKCVRANRRESCHATYEWVMAHTQTSRLIERVGIISLSFRHALSHSTLRISVEALSLTPLLRLIYRVRILSLSCIHALPHFTWRISVEALSLTPLLRLIHRVRMLSLICTCPASFYVTHRFGGPLSQPSFEAHIQSENNLSLIHTWPVSFYVTHLCGGPFSHTFFEAYVKSWYTRYEPRQRCVVTWNMLTKVYSRERIVCGRERERELEMCVTYVVRVYLWIYMHLCVHIYRCVYMYR